MKRNGFGTDAVATPTAELSNHKEFISFADFGRNEINCNKFHLLWAFGRASEWDTQLHALLVVIIVVVVCAFFLDCVCAHISR